MPTKKPVKTAIEKKPWGRLIDLYEREMLKLFKRFRPSEPTSQALEAIAQDPKFQKAAERTAERMVSEVAFTSAKSWREAVMKATHSRRIYGALQQEMNRPAMREAYRNLLDENAKLIKSIPYDLAQKVTRYAAEEVGKGKRTGNLMKMLRVHCAELTANKIKLIARTEISKAHTEVTRVRSEDLDVPAYVWITSNDRRVRESHRKMNDIIVFWNDPPSPEALIGQKSTLGKYHGGECPNCFTGDTKLVSPHGLKTVWRAPYSGKLIEIILETGERFRATPNHPILTNNGWVAAGLLDTGDYLVHLGLGGDSSIEPYRNNYIPTFDDVFSAASVEGKSSISFGLNFHGDVIRDNVDQISVTGDLNIYGQIGRSHGVCDFDFSNPNCGVVERVNSIIFKIAGSRGSGFRDNSTSISEGHRLHSDVISSGYIASGNFIQKKIFPDRVSRNSQVLGKSIFAPLIVDIERSQDFGFDSMLNASSGRFGLSESSLIQGFSEKTFGTFSASAECGDSFPIKNSYVRVVEKLVSEFSGHVYTCETNSGWYGVTPTGIISKNCRCEPLPLVSLDEVTWPHRVYRNGSIMMMNRTAFQNLYQRKAA